MRSSGRCHICVAQGRYDSKPVDYCSVCKHWFCESCRTKWFDRTWEFLKEQFGGKKPGCCGIMEW